jgi:hypothetical protein
LVQLLGLGPFLAPILLWLVFLGFLSKSSPFRSILFYSIVVARSYSGYLSFLRDLFGPLHVEQATATHCDPQVPISISNPAGWPPNPFNHFSTQVSRAWTKVLSGTSIFSEF